MRGKRFVGGTIVALAVFLVATGVARADWVTGFYCWDSYYVEHWWGGKAQIQQGALWDQYHDGQRYTLYRITTSGYGWIQVDSESEEAVKKEVATLYNWENGVECSNMWYDYVYPGDTWWRDYPFSDRELAKPEDPYSDGTSMDWWFVWNVVIWGDGCWGNNPRHSDWFFYSITQFYHGYGCD